MDQILQSLRTGALEIASVPCPAAAPNSVLIRSRASLISAGTERMLLQFGRAGWIDKARQQPDKVRMVIEKFKTDGALATLDSVRAKLDRQITLGYSNAGIVINPGSTTTEFRVGDRVVSNAAHAEVVTAPKNLCARIPDGVRDDAAAFAVVSAIALQGIRLVEPSLGETVVVTGLGLIGLIAVQLLRAHGCRVIGIDLDARKLDLAQSFGAEPVNLSAGEDPIAAASSFTRGRGVDAVIITAATQSSEPVHQAACMCRKRGSIVLVGVTGLELSRDDFYKKELSFQVSCSYGPGRYDPAYEGGGQDYPLPYVRWTAQRNFEAVLEMMDRGALQAEPLITHRFPFERALDAYELLDGHEFHLGILLEYPSGETDVELLSRRIALQSVSPSGPRSRACLGFIGAGGYATKVLIPAFQKAGARLAAIASSGGLSAAYASRKFGFDEATTDVEDILANPAIDTVSIATRHDSHAPLVCRAARAGKHVFVEKPLALNLEQLDEIEETWRYLAEPRLLMAGFNRRFAPHAVRMRELLAGIKDPKTFVYTVNAGSVPSDHWTQDPELGGGRILGEACHFIDLLRFLAGSPAKDVQTARQGADTITITIAYEDGSTGTIHYFSQGHKSFPKERLEAFCGGRVLALDNFRNLRGYGWPGFKNMKLWRQNKGADEMAAAFVSAIHTGAASPIAFDELVEVARTTIKAASL